VQTEPSKLVERLLASTPEFEGLSVNLDERKGTMKSKHISK